MGKLPVVVASSVIRSTHQGESHGGVYLVDLDTAAVDQVIDWDESSISWEGRGADRGLRGIAFHGEEIYLAASDELFVYDPQFRLTRSLRNRYLKHCHEICISGQRLYATSTGVDSVLEYDLVAGQFVAGYHLRLSAAAEALRKLRRYGLRPMPNLDIFDPNAPGGPTPQDRCHINNVHHEDGSTFVSGTGLGHLLCIRGSRMRSHARIPYGTHNSQPFDGGVLCNHTEGNAVTHLTLDGRPRISFPIPRYEPAELAWTQLPGDHARQAFGRGLCVFADRYLIAGSSPATIAVHDLTTGETVQKVSLTKDVRNAVHGLQIWPYASPRASRKGIGLLQ